VRLGPDSPGASRTLVTIGGPTVIWRVAVGFNRCRYYAAVGLSVETIWAKLSNLTKTRRVDRPDRFGVCTEDQLQLYVSHRPGNRFDHRNAGRLALVENQPARADSVDAVAVSICSLPGTLFAASPLRCPMNSASYFLLPAAPIQ
jgi:hypothetical protein